MSSIKNLSLLLALSLGSIAASGCAADAPDDNGGGGGGGGGGGDEGGGDETSTPTDAAGKYTMRSNFDLAANAPGKVGEVVNAIIDATDDPDDPANWLITQVANNVGQPYKGLINGAKPFIAGYLNDRLLQYAPDFVGTMIQVGNDFGQVAKNFGTNEQLEITGSTGAFTSTHTVLGAHFKIDNIESDYAFSAYNTANVVVPNVGVTLDTAGNFAIANHMVPLSYGKIMRIGLDAAIIPLIDSTASNLGELMQHQVDCASVGQMVASQIGGFGSGAIAAACNAGLVQAANLVYAKIDGLDSSALELGLTGSAKALDTNNDHKVDKIQTGAWAGSTSYAGTPSTLTGATFFGERM